MKNLARPFFLITFLVFIMFNLTGCSTPALDYQEYMKDKKRDGPQVQNEQIRYDSFRRTQENHYTTMPLW